MSKEMPFLRYTNSASLLDTLLNKRIFLLDPKLWEDTNDSYYLSVYKEKEKLKTVLAICFAEAHETFHHWKVFSGNISGVCIEFYKDKLLSNFKDNKNIVMQTVEYKKIDQLEKDKQMNSIKNCKLPFYKRYPYRDENEFRIIYKSATENLQTKAFPIDIKCIKQILLSYLMPDVLYESTKNVIQTIEGCEKIQVIKTSLIDNEKWKSIISSDSTTTRSSEHGELWRR
jgi:hypothetical protein